MFAQALSLLFHNSDQKQNKRTEIFFLKSVPRTVRLQLFVSYLKGLNVNRLLLAIVLPSAPPVIIFQNQRPLTSLLTSHQGTSGGRTFSPRPVQQRCTAASSRVISHGEMNPGEKMRPTFIQDVQFDVCGNKMRCVIPPSDKHSEHEPKSLQVVSTISLKSKNF